MNLDIKGAIELYNKKNNLSGNERITLSKLAIKIDYKSRNFKTIQSDFSKFQNGKLNCPIIIVKQICKILNCSSDQLLQLD